MRVCLCDRGTNGSKNSDRGKTSTEALTLVAGVVMSGFQRIEFFIDIVVVFFVFV